MHMLTFVNVHYVLDHYCQLVSLLLNVGEDIET